MKKINAYNVHFVGLRSGESIITYEIDKSFFSLFEDSPIEYGDIYVHLNINKQQGFFSLNFFIDGSVQAECDRCMEKFDLPVNGNYVLYVKLEEEAPPKTEADVIYISPLAHSLNVSQYIYEYIILSIPMYKTCDMSDLGKQCNEEVLRYMNKWDKQQVMDPRWNQLKDISK